MTRKKFATVIKLLAVHKLHKTRGDYKLKSGEPVSIYYQNHVTKFLHNNHMGFGTDGNVYQVKQVDTIDSNHLNVIIPQGVDEISDHFRQFEAVQKFVQDLIGGNV